MIPENFSIAILIPCYDEEMTIGDVVSSFRTNFPTARIYVYDNNSNDSTARKAKEAGAIVRSEPRQGKGNVVRQMFADIDADIYILADGDNAHPAPPAIDFTNTLIEKRLDMVIGTRMIGGTTTRRYHAFGNKMFNRLVEILFNRGMSDVFSGYRVFNRRFVKSFPAISRGFEIEMELSVHALDLRLPFIEIPFNHGERPEGSVSKLRTFHDGFKIMWRMLVFLAETRPFRLFTWTAALMLIIAIILAIPIIETFIKTSTVPRFPTAFGIVGLIMLSGVIFTSGIILEGIARFRRENKRLHYLSLSPFRSGYHDLK
ncbi:MAG: glycosyltransferase family 2 protein [Rickettsiales bacterium]